MQGDAERLTFAYFDLAIFNFSDLNPSSVHEAFTRSGNFKET
jgi:hypothetical protein